MKYFIALAFFAFVCATATAQLAIKPAAGINLTDFSKDPATGKFKAKAGYQLGGTIAFGKKAYIEPGFFWVKKSTEYITEDTNEEDITFDISGIRIPVSIGANLAGNEKSLIGLRVFCGASAFLLTSIKDLDKDDFKTASWGVFAGAGLDIAIVFVELSHEWSLTNIRKNISQIDIGKSRSLFINAGIRLPL
ncbi:MAG: outer membrane beta-barrel protein [Chitinophagaceae bacterium]|nr:outer membrane beta-barrel protein [Chitinophagaceae bacterium]